MEYLATLKILDFLPEKFQECLEKTCHSEISHECQLTPDVFTLIGLAGVALMIFESGMHFDFEKAKKVATEN